MARSGDAGPPEDAYGRVTHPERFAPLHPAARALVDELVAAYDVERSEGRGLDPEREAGAVEPAAPAIRLTPRDPRAAPLCIVFLSFPGVIIRAGAWHVEAFPACGCDACDEQPGEQIALLAAFLDAVVAGRLRESIEVPAVGDAYHHRFLGTHHPNGGISYGEGWSLIPRSDAERRIQKAGRASFDWAPWQRRE